MEPINAYGTEYRNVGRQGVPSTINVLDDPGRDELSWGVQYEGMGPHQPHLNQGLSQQGISDYDLLPGRYAADGSTLHWKGIPAAKAL